MNKFINNNLLLKNELAVKLYDEIKDMPIFDFHCHLDPKEIYENKVFHNICELWLESDHYKWRLMRVLGFNEDEIGGNISPKEKFHNFIKTLELSIGSPVYIWAMMELKQYFNISLPLTLNNADKIYDMTEKLMSDNSYSARNLIKMSNVDTIITTDDPISNLEYHKLLRDENLGFKVLPCIRMDNLLNIDGDGYFMYLEKLSEVVGFRVDSYHTLLKAIENRVEYFKSEGALSMDISFKDIPYDSLNNPNDSFKDIKDGYISEDNVECFKFYLLKDIARILKESDMVMQLHIGVLRNQDTKEYIKHGRDIGRDSMGDPISVEDLNILLDRIERESGLPKMIIYPLNPTNYYSVMGSLLDYSKDERGKMQLGAAWWFNDHEDSIRSILDVYKNESVLGVFNGMLTDSRSYTSYARHDYFRRILCSYVSEIVLRGEYPNNFETLVKILKDISFNNSKNYFKGVN